MKGRENPHILTLSPPISLEPKWVKPAGYMMAKYGMTLCGLAMAEEFRADGIASNMLWPRTLVATTAVQNILGADEVKRARKAAVYADAAYEILTRPASDYTGNTVLCEDVLVESGVTDLSIYDCVAGSELGLDLWVESPNPPGYAPT
jgi:citronellol/citronellal dehydrogenase